jgi:glycosyltransferase involved in cell wall biosynthesis
MAHLRVAQIVLSLAPGGTERLVLELVRRTRRVCDSLVICLDEEGAWGADLKKEGVSVLSLGRRAGFHPAIGWRIASAIRQHHADVLHCHQYTPFVYGTIAAALTGSGLVFTEHGRLSDAPASIKRRLVNPVVGRLGGALFAVSDHLRTHMLAEGLPPSRVSVIWNGIDPGPAADPEARRAARRRLLLPMDAIVIGTAARLDPVKDLGTLLDAFKELSRVSPTARLVILGDGPERHTLAAHADALGVAQCVLFAGFREDVRDLLPAIDIFVNSSTSEGISLTILEAMAAALPVVATAVGGTPEVVIPHQTGLLVPARDPHGLAAALTDLSADAPRRRRYGSRGRERVLEHFTLDRMIADYVAQYERAARRVS